MITGASHSLHNNLSDSLSLYRQQLDAQKLQQTNTPPAASQLPTTEQPTPPPSYDVVVELNQIPLSDQLKLAAEERRDIARETAMSVESLQQKQDVINTYVNSANNANETSSSSSSNSYEVSPGEVYTETLNYQKRQDLMSAFQQAAGGDQLGRIVDTTV